MGEEGQVKPAKRMLKWPAPPSGPLSDRRRRRQHDTCSPRPWRARDRPITLPPWPAGSHVARNGRADAQPRVCRSLLVSAAAGPLPSSPYSSYSSYSLSRPSSPYTCMRDSLQPMSDGIARDSPDAELLIAKQACAGLASTSLSIFQAPQRRPLPRSLHRLLIIPALCAPSCLPNSKVPWIKSPSTSPP